MNTHELTSAAALATLREAQITVAHFTLLAMGTGAVPVPAASVAIVAENAAMLGVIAAQFGVPVTVRSVVSSLGLAGTLNQLGRAVFIEGARLLGWGAGPGGPIVVSALGASTAGIQTWIVGQLTIAIAQNNGVALPASHAEHGTKVRGRRSRCGASRRGRARPEDSDPRCVSSPSARSTPSPVDVREVASIGFVDPPSTNAPSLVGLRPAGQGGLVVSRADRSTSWRAIVTERACGHRAVIRGRRARCPRPPRWPCPRRGRSSSRSPHRPRRPPALRPLRQRSRPNADHTPDR